MMPGISWHKFKVPTSGTLVQVDNDHFLAICGHFGEKYCIFLPILVYEIDFHVQEKSKNTIGNNGGNISEGGLPRKKISQKWPNFHHFWRHFERFL